jgi:hypothetical protein
LNSRETPYYSIREGRNPNITFDLPFLRRVFFDLYAQYEQDGYFQQAFGYYCVDAGTVAGSLGSDIEAYVRRKLRKEDLWPVEKHYKSYEEDDLFDMVELLFDVISKPSENGGYYHSYSNCGWHYSSFDVKPAQDDFRANLNEVLRDYESGFVLSEQGEIQTIAIAGTESLLEAELVTHDPENIDERVTVAIRKFRAYQATAGDRRDAVRGLGDVLEYLRAQLKDSFTKQDESDIFNLLNNFGIRHHNMTQKSDYDESIFLEWSFYYLLSATHAALRLLARSENRGAS